MKAFAQSIVVQGDFVMEKKVEYEVSNVEAGGIGIQVVNGNADAQAELATDKSHVAEADMAEAKPPHARGPRKQYLFIEGDASWEEKGRQRHTWKENSVVRRRERDSFLQYLSNHKLGNRELTCTQGDTLNDTVACFLVEWQRRGLIAQDFAGTSVWRFLTEECGIKSAVTPKAYGKEIKKWVAKKLYSATNLAQIEDFMKKPLAE